MKKIIAIICLVTGITASAAAQDSVVQNLHFYHVLHSNAPFNTNDYESGGKKPFYIYRNCVYRIYLWQGGNWLIRVTDIRNDSIYYQHFGPQTSYRKDSLFRLHPLEINSILTYEQSLGQMFNTIQLVNYRAVFSYDLHPKRFPERTVMLYSRDSTRGEKVKLVTFLHAKSTALLFLKCNRPYYYYDTTTLDCENGVALTPPPPYPKFERNVVWFTPSRAQQINGLNIGIQTFGFNKDPLTIKGVNLNADLMGAIITMYLPFIPRDSAYKIRNMPDTIWYSEAVDKIHGLSISGGGLIGAGRLDGVAFNGLICLLTVSKGICITGLNNRIDEFHGLVIAGLGNRSIKGSGLQIGLVNKCKHLRGIQIGLWNENGRRKFPIINWNFSKKTV
ncbi:LA_2272 family surface repeat-containing protein [Pseudobacter ginsenosidimutans]|uniref:Uncharacterized protein n=1 Tax=Pseudobacter ginsenosidimutans TaxID=661488 RepID=A0A4Q7MQ45_9BACT|nr:hypothetical protein [Pseudobacter ginsenosidimutans]QEC42330.1 hypothetical protein FSB84_11750 [Pseudobacter ginsenosidimutans]RZS70822.1 hypothetical protein EV199_2717 [Pseudobacter ginsenosidimutans]